MFVYNDCKHDARVLKEAKSLARAGYDVRIIALLSKDTLPYEERDGFKIARVVRDPVHYRALRGFRNFRPASLALRLLSVLKMAMLFLSRARVMVGEKSNGVLLPFPWHHKLRARLKETWANLTYKARESSRYIRSVVSRHPRLFLSFSFVFLVVRYSYRGLRYGYRKGIRPIVRMIRLSARYGYRGLRYGYRKGIRPVVRMIRLSARYSYRGLRYGYRKGIRPVIQMIRGWVYSALRSSLMLFHKPLCYWDYYRRSLELVAQEPADIYHAHDLNTLPVAYWAVRRYGGKLLYDSHELYTERNTLKPMNRIHKSLVSSIENFLVRRCNAIITVSESIATELAKRYRIPHPYVIINAPSLAKTSINTAVQSLRKSLDISDQYKILLYSGGLTFGRGLAKTIESLQYLPSCYFVMMGYGSEDYVKYLRELAIKHNVVSRIAFFGPVAPQEVITFVSTADLGIAAIENTCLSYYYCSPNKLFEYIAAGIPVVASDFPELRRIVEEFKVGCTFNPDDPKDIARAINWVLEDEQRLVELKANARKAAAVLNWDNEEKKLLAIYKRLTR